ncbi:MAG TPA: hypothetical protein VGE83_10320 [Terracidiphilus sp.]|jgi:hypothetical protein
MKKLTGKMIQTHFASKLYYRLCCLVLFFVAAAASFNGFYDKWHFRETGTGAFMPGASFDSMLEGTALRPYVYRQLLPMLADWIDARVPEQTKDRLYEARLYNGKLFRDDFIDSPLARSRPWFLRYWVVYAAVFLFAWIAVYAMYLAGKAAGYPPPASALAAIAMILLLPYLLTRGGFFYDFPELAFFALVVWMALRFDWVWIVPVVALAAWNKESFLLFIPALYPLLRRRSSRVSALAGTAILGLTGVLVYCLLRLRFQHNPGGTVELHLLDQIDYMLHPSNLLLREKTYGLLVIQGFNPLLWALIAWTALRGWRFLPRPIQRHAQIAAIINFPLYLLFCVPGELRDLSLLYVTFLFLLAANLTVWAGERGDAPGRQSA